MNNPFKKMGLFQLIKLLIKFSALIIAIIKVLEFAVETILPEWEKFKEKNEPEKKIANGELSK